MYCPSCGDEIKDSVEFCPSCGHEVGAEVGESLSESGASEYDIVMSVEDGIRRRTPLRLTLDVIAIFVTAGFWGGWLIMEFIQHHYKLKKGETEPWEEGDEKSFNIL